MNKYMSNNHPNKQNSLRLATVVLAFDLVAFFQVHNIRQRQRYLPQAGDFGR